MKKILFILIAFLGFLSCESDDGISYTKPDYLSGKWVIKQIGGINAQNVLVYQNYVNDDNCENDNLIFNTDGTFEANDYTSVGSNCENDKISGGYNLYSNQLTLKYNVENAEEEIVYTIITLTFNQIQVSFTDPDTGLLVFLKLEK